MSCTPSASARHLFQNELVPKFVVLQDFFLLTTFVAPPYRPDDFKELIAGIKECGVLEVLNTKAKAVLDSIVKEISPPVWLLTEGLGLLDETRKKMGQLFNKVHFHDIFSSKTPSSSFSQLPSNGFPQLQVDSFVGKNSSLGAVFVQNKQGQGASKQGTVFLVEIRNLLCMSHVLVLHRLVTSHRVDHVDVLYDRHVSWICAVYDVTTTVGGQCCERTHDV